MSGSCAFRIYEVFTTLLYQSLKISRIVLKVLTSDGPDDVLGDGEIWDFEGVLQVESLYPVEWWAEMMFLFYSA